MPRTLEITVKVKLRKLRGEEISDEGYDREDVTEYHLDDIEGDEIAESIKDAIDSWLGLDCGEDYIIDEGPAAITKITTEV